MNHDPRDLEWQRRYEQNDTPWDKGKAAPPLTDFLRRGGMTGRILVPGCGRGHDARAVAETPGASVVGLDLSVTAVEEARKLTNQANFTGEISFVPGDFFAPPPELIHAFDWVVEHTCFCAIEPQRRPDYARAAAAALRQGGKLFAIFYLNPGQESGPPFPASREEIERLFSPYFKLLENWTPAECFPGRENREWVTVMEMR